MKRRDGNFLALSKQYIAEWERRVAEQRQRLARLKLKGQPRDKELASLRNDELLLLKLRNHADVMQDLMNISQDTAATDPTTRVLRSNSWGADSR
jgi:hypothetical protein